MRIAILGGGVGGLGLAYFLSRHAPTPLRIDLFEEGAAVGGLAGKFQHRGRWFDRHYHVVLASDRHLRGLIRDLGLEAALTFARSRSGLWDGSRIIPFDDPLDLVRFPYLGWVDKARLIATILFCQHAGDPEGLHAVELEPWLVRLGGARAFERVWAPLLRTKFDGAFDGIPATYLWSRIRRMQSTRDTGGAVEKLGILRGGTHALVDSLTAVLPQTGDVTIETNARVTGLEPEGRSTWVYVDGREPRGPYDVVVSTLPSPVHDRVARSGGAAARVPVPDRYLGLIDVVVVLERQLSPYYTLYLLDPSLPFTGVMETTNLVPGGERGGTHLVYLPRYADAAGKEYGQDDETLKARYVGRLFEMFPELDPGDVQGVYLFRERFVEPVHLVGGAFPVFPESLETRRPGVYLMNTGRLYPLLHNCQAVVAMAHRTALYLLERHG